MQPSVACTMHISRENQMKNLCLGALLLCSNDLRLLSLIFICSTRNPQTSSHFSCIRRRSMLILPTVKLGRQHFWTCEYSTKILKTVVVKVHQQEKFSHSFSEVFSQRKMDTHTHNEKKIKLRTMYKRNHIFIRLRHWNLHIFLLFNFDRTYIMFVHDFFERHFPRKLLFLLLGTFSKSVQVLVLRAQVLRSATAKWREKPSKNTRRKLMNIW